MGALKCHSTKRAAQSVMHTMTRGGHAVSKCKFVEGTGWLNNSDGASITYVHVFTFLNKCSAEGEQVWTLRVQ